MVKQTASILFIYITYLIPVRGTIISRSKIGITVMNSETTVDNLVVSRG